MKEDMPQNRGTSPNIFSTSVKCNSPRESRENHQGHVGLGWMLCSNKSVSAACIFKYYQYATKLVKIEVFKWY